MGSMFGTINTFSQERPVFLREQANKMYGISAYFMAKTMVELPVFFFSPLLGTIIIYFGMRLEFTANQFFGHYLSIVLINLSASSIGYGVSSLFENPATSQAMAPIIVLPAILFGGLSMNLG